MSSSRKFPPTVRLSWSLKMMDWRGQAQEWIEETITLQIGGKSVGLRGRSTHVSTVRCHELGSGVILMTCESEVCELRWAMVKMSFPKSDIWMWWRPNFLVKAHIVCISRPWSERSLSWLELRLGKSDMKCQDTDSSIIWPNHGRVIRHSDCYTCKCALIQRLHKEFWEHRDDKMPDTTWGVQVNDSRLVHSSSSWWCHSWNSGPGVSPEQEPNRYLRLAYMLSDERCHPNATRLGKVSEEEPWREQAELSN